MAMKQCRAPVPANTYRKAGRCSKRAKRGGLCTHHEEAPKINQRLMARRGT